MGGLRRLREIRRVLSSVCALTIAVSCASTPPFVERHLPPGETPWVVPPTELGTQRLFRVRLETPEGRGRFRLLLRLDREDHYRIDSTHPLFNRRLWSFSSEDDLKTYLHWIVRDVFFRLRAVDESAPLGLRLGDRTVTLEISAPGRLPVRLSTREAGTAGVRLPDSDTIYYFQPLILDEATKRVAVKVLVKDGPFFGEGTAQEIAFVVAEFGSPRITASDPILEIRCVGIQ